MKRIALIMMGFLLLPSFFVAIVARADERAPKRLELPMVVDSRGKIVGTFFFVNRIDLPGSSVLRKIGELWYLLPISPMKGFLPTGTELFYTTSNCSGTAYVAAFPDVFVLLPRSASDAGVANGILYYPTPGSIKPSTSLVFKSARLISPDGKSLNCGATKGFSLPNFAGKMATFDLSTLGFVTPFKLTQSGQ